MCEPPSQATVVLCSLSTGHLQRLHQAEPRPGSPAALLLERPAVGPHALRTVLHRGVGPEGESYRRWLAVATFGSCAVL